MKTFMLVLFIVLGSLTWMFFWYNIALVVLGEAVWTTGLKIAFEGFLGVMTYKCVYDIGRES